jgi:DNA-binding SARP family transcriptional activator/tetratricopeptide (TPR) repeat protein
MPLRVGVLGPVTVWRDDAEVAAGQPRQRAVLGLLAARANRVVSRGELVDAVWGDEPPATAEGGIYTYVAGLRRVLEPDRPRRGPERSRLAPASLLVSTGGGYVLRLGPGCLDADCFEQALGTARGLRASGDPQGAARAVDEALALWRGMPFAGVPGPFAEAERQRLTELHTTAAEERADLMLARGHAAEAVPELAALVAEHPLRERTWGLLMVALYRCGRQAEALSVFQEARGRLAEDLGLDPGVELTRIHHQLLAMDPALDAVQALPAAGEAGPVGLLSPVLSAVGGPARPRSAVTAPAADAGAAAAIMVPCPAQLPPEPAGFAGRAAELGWLHALEADADGCPIALVTGTAGVGKTTLAIRFARQAGPRFPDGQLYVNLRGFDPASAPVSPSAALAGFFDALGVPPRHVPASLEAQSALLRTLLDGKRMLLLLDNACDAGQVRPLLPGSAGCMVVVTSRSQLTGLVVAEGARPLPLDVLDPVEATELLVRRLGSERVTAEPHAVAALVEQAACLPLALSVTCARAAARPAARLADLSAELADALDRLDALRTGEVSTDLRAVFSWSVAKLSEPAARTFRLFGLHPGPDISAPAVASLTAATLPEARAALAELTRASLLTEDAAGRFGCHDLLRGYAAELAAAAETDGERAAAARRILDHYLGTAQAASMLLRPARARVPPPSAAPGVATEEFSGDPHETALAWFAAEHRVLRNVVELALAEGADEHCWKLSWYWVQVLKRRGRLPEVLEVQRTALRAAARLADSDALARVHWDLGHVSGRLGDYQDADKHLRRALGLFTALGDQIGVAQARHGIALVLTYQDRWAEAIDHAIEGLRLRRAFAEESEVAYSENTVGWIRAHLGQHDEALGHCQRALELHRASGSKTGMADTLDSIAYAYGGLADYGRAIAHYEQSLDLYRLIGDPEGEAGTLLRLGDAQLAADRPAAARCSWEQALAVVSRIPGADTSDATGRIALLARQARTRVAALSADPEEPFPASPVAPVAPAAPAAPAAEPVRF